MEFLNLLTWAGLGVAPVKMLDWQSMGLREGLANRAQPSPSDAICRLAGTGWAAVVAIKLGYAAQYECDQRQRFAKV